MVAQWEKVYSHHQKSGRTPLCSSVVTMKTYADEKAGMPADAAFNSLCRGRPCQERLAKALHRAARVSAGPCRRGELDLFAVALSDYHINVFDAESCFLACINILPSTQSFWSNIKTISGVTTVPALVGRSYYCHD